MKTNKLTKLALYQRLLSYGSYEAYRIYRVSRNLSVMSREKYDYFVKHGIDHIPSGYQPPKN